MIERSQSDVASASPTHVPAAAAFRIPQQQGLSTKPHGIDRHLAAYGWMRTILSVHFAPTIIQQLPRGNGVSSLRGGEQGNASPEDTGVRTMRGAGLRLGLWRIGKFLRLLRGQRNREEENCYNQSSHEASYTGFVVSAVQVFAHLGGASTYKTDGKLKGLQRLIVPQFVAQIVPAAIAASLLLCLMASPLLAQNTTVVTGTITDSNGIPYANATVQAQLLPTGVTPTEPPPCNGQSATNCTVSAYQRGTANAAGVFSMTLASNAVLSPGGTTWQFTVTEPGSPPPLGTGPQSCSATLTISGASQSVSSSFSGCPALSNVSGGLTAYPTLAALVAAPCTVGTTPPAYVQQQPWTIFYCIGTQGQAGTWSGARTENLLDPVGLGVQPNGVLGGDGTTANGSNIFYSTNVNCSQADLGKLLLVVGGTVNGNYPFGIGLVTVGVGGVACGGTGNAGWLAGIGGVAQNAGATVAGTANWAIGTASGALLQQEYTAQFSTGLLPGKIMALPCGVMIVEVSPFISPTTISFMAQSPDVQGCNATRGTVFVLHPNIMAAYTSAGGTIFANNQATNSTAGAFASGVAGISSQAKISNIVMTTLGGYLPAAAGKSYSMISNFNIVENIFANEMGMTSNAGGAEMIASNGELVVNRLNFQIVITPNGVSWGGVFVSGQGENVIENSIFAFNGIYPAVTCSGGSNCTVKGNYIVQVYNAIEAPSGGDTITVVDSDIVGCAPAFGGIGCITDNGNASTFYLYANYFTCGSVANGCIQLTNAGSTLDISGTQLTDTTGAYELTGTGTVNDRSGNLFGHAFSNFSGKVNFIGGGSMAAAISTGTGVAGGGGTGTNFGTPIGSTALVPNVLFTGPMNVYVETRQSLLGTTCGAGSNTATVTISYTAAKGTPETLAATGNQILTISANGTVDIGEPGSSLNTVWVASFTPEIGTAVNYSVASALLSAGCTVIPQYTVDLRVQ
jgi:hypothetical protein